MLGEIVRRVGPRKEGHPIRLEAGGVDDPVAIEGVLFRDDESITSRPRLGGRDRRAHDQRAAGGMQIREELPHERGGIEDSRARRPQGAAATHQRLATSDVSGLQPLEAAHAARAGVVL